MDAKTIPVLTVAWWKKNKDLTSGGETMTKALQSFESAKATCDKEPSRDRYMKLIETLDAISDAASAQAKKLNSTFRGGMIAGLKNYEGVVKKTLVEIQKEHKSYLAKLADYLEKFGQFEERINKAVSSTMMERGKADQAMKFFDRACTIGKGLQVKAQLEIHLENAKEFVKVGEKLEDDLGKLFNEATKHIAQPDFTALIGSTSVRVHQRVEDIQKWAAKDVKALRETINSKSEEQLRSGGEAYRKKVQEYLAARSKIVKEAQTLVVSVGKTAKAVNKLTPETRNLEKETEELKKQLAEHLKAAESTRSQERALNPKRKELDYEDIEEAENKPPTLMEMRRGIEKSCESMNEKLEELLRAKREQAERQRQQEEEESRAEQLYQLKLSTFNQVINELETQTTNWAQQLPNALKAVNGHIKLMNSRSFNKVEAGKAYDELNVVYKGANTTRSELRKQVEKVTEMKKKDQSSLTKQLARLVQSIEATQNSAIERLKLLAPAIA